MARVAIGVDVKFFIYVYVCDVIIYHVLYISILCFFPCNSGRKFNPDEECKSGELQSILGREH